MTYQDVRLSEKVIDFSSFLLKMKMKTIMMMAKDDDDEATY